jgi:predicted transcriptional regulator of viral defense system
MHPLTPDLSNLPTEELSTKYNELVKRMLQAQRMGNGSLINQVGMILDDYRVELSKRQQKLLDDANKNASFKNIIDIN